VSPLHFLAAVLAVYCVSLFVSKLSGPGHVFSRLRRQAKGSVKEGLSCPLCFGTWIAALVTTFLAYRGYLPWVEWPLWTFAIAGANAIIHLLDPI
jgi:hypothetical protein